MEKGEKICEKIVKGPRGWGTRHTIALLCFFASAVSYAIRFNLSLAIVAMVKHNVATAAVTETEIMDPLTNLDILTISPITFTANVPCPNLIEIPLNSSHDLDGITQATMSTGSSSSSGSGEFSWNEAEQGVILGSFFWGYVLTQLPAGFLCKKFGGKWPLGIGLLIAAIFTILTPWAARTHKGLLIFARIMEGLASGVHISAQTTILASWSPPNERSLLCTIAYGGTFVGTAVTMIVSGYLIHGNVFGGWPSVFYSVGIFSIAWFAVWSFLVSNTPADHTWISKEEKEYIEKSLGSQKSKDISNIRTPWKEVVTSVPIWATAIAHTAHAWGIYTLLTEMPTYMKTVLHFNIKKNSWLSAVPYLASWVVGISFANAADMLLRRNIVKIITVRKAAMIIAHGGSALALIGCAYSGCNQVLTVFFLIVSVSLTGIANSGFVVSYVDIAPNHAGIIIGAVNTIANLCGVGAPYVAGLLINNDPSVENWKIVFFISAAFLITGAITFAFFASGTEQPWNNFQKILEIPHVKSNDDDDDDDDDADSGGKGHRKGGAGDCEPESESEPMTKKGGSLLDQSYDNNKEGDNENGHYDDDIDQNDNDDDSKEIMQPLKKAEVTPFLTITAEQNN